MPRVQGFTPSSNGLQFVNSWPDEPAIEVDVPGLGRVGIGNASNGLCGGMVFTVRDVFEAGLPPLRDPRPPQGSPLFSYIVRRLIDSFDVPAGVLKYYEWMTTPDHDVDLWLVTRRGVAWKTVREEWPLIRADLDAGHPSPLGLVTVASANPADLGRNHQVLAYGYDLVRDVLTLHLYDPNTDPAQGDSTFLRLSVADPAGGAAIQHNVGIADPIRGFFHVEYERADPSGLEPH
jgi:hypothetical protein